MKKRGAYYAYTRFNGVNMPISVNFQMIASLPKLVSVSYGGT